MIRRLFAIGTAALTLVLTACASSASSPGSASTSSAGSASSPVATSSAKPSAASAESASAAGVCHILTPAEETAILGQPPAGGTRVYRTAEGWNCVFGAGPVQTAAGLKFHIIAQEELDCGSAVNEKQAWVAFAKYGSRWQADSAAPVWSLSRKPGGALGVILRNGCVFSSGAAITNKAIVVPGSQQAALAAMNEVYSRAG
jgi:hypothetical protein